MTSDKLRTSIQTFAAYGRSEMRRSHPAWEHSGSYSFLCFTESHGESPHLMSPNCVWYFDGPNKRDSFPAQLATRGSIPDNAEHFPATGQVVFENVHCTVFAKSAYGKRQ